MSKIFNEQFLQQIIKKLNNNPDFLEEAKYASFTFGFHDSKTNKKSWIEIIDGRLSKVGLDSNTEPDFTFIGETTAWDRVVVDEPLNRLIRRAELRVTGDKRLCMKNWKMLWLFGQKIKEV